MTLIITMRDMVDLALHDKNKYGNEVVIKYQTNLFASYTIRDLKQILEVNQASSTIA